MAQKAAKQTARRNSTALNNLHLISLCVNVFFILYRFLWRSATTSRRAIILYAILNAPALITEFYLERIGRPSADGRRSGEDVNAEGLMEMLWDVVYVTWFCMVVVAFAGEWAWWIWSIIPVYGAYAAYSAATGMRSSMAGLGGPAQDGAAALSSSKRQAKMEKRGAEGKVKYR